MPHVISYSEKAKATVFDKLKVVLVKILLINPSILMMRHLISSCSSFRGYYFSGIYCGGNLR